MYSVIIPAKNESKNIGRCIRSIYNSVKNDGAVEVIVVDNDSEDDTASIARREGAKVLFVEKANISGLRNFGAAHSSHDIVAFIDADCEALPGWLDNAATILLDENVGVTGEFPLIPKVEANWIESAFYGVPPSKRRVVPYLGSCNLVMRKKIFDSVGGFDIEAITGEDYILCQKIKAMGLLVVADPQVAVIHYGFPKTLRAVFKREVWHGLGMIDLYHQGRITLPLIWSIVNVSLLLAIPLGIIAKSFTLTILFCFLFILGPLGAAFLRMKRMNSYGALGQLYLIFFVYGIARTISLLKIIGCYGLNATRRFFS